MDLGHRRLADYLPIGLRWAPIGATAFVAIGIGFTRVVYVVPIGPDAPSGFSLDAGVAACLALAGLVWLAQAHVIGQRISLWISISTAGTTSAPMTSVFP